MIMAFGIGVIVGVLIAFIVMDGDGR